MTMVELTQVSVTYGALKAVKDMNLHLAAGEVLGLFGHNGAGKTTTMKLILGLLRASSGRACVLGQSPQQADIRAQLGYLPENVAFYPQLTGRETLDHFARLKSANAAQVAALLEQVGLRQAADRRVKTYSKGMRQRLGLAQALLGTPRLLLLDEPTVGLDPIATQDLYQLIQNLRAQGTAVILCSHVLAGVEHFIDRAAIMAEGQLRVVGTLPELRAQVDLPSQIRISAHHAAQQWQQQLREAGYTSKLLNQHSLLIDVHHSERQDLFGLLAARGMTADIEIRQPGMEALYRHFMQNTASKGDEA